MRKRFLLLAMVMIAAVAASWYLLAPVPLAAEPSVGITVGKTAPSFTLNGLDGNPVAVGNSGRITILNFWATWCPPCRQEMPELDMFSKRHPDDLIFYAVNLQEPADAVKGFMEQNQYSMPVLLDSEGQVGAAFVIRAIPTTIILDKNGVIQFRKSGPVTAPELEAVIAELAD